MLLVQEEARHSMGQCGWFPLPYDEIVEWVERHQESLPTTLAELSQYPVAFRRVIVNHVSNDRRTAFWQDHLATFLLPEAALTAAQRVCVEEAIAQLPDIFASPLLEARAKMAPLMENIQPLFSRERCAAMFGMVGPLEPPEGLPIPPGTRLTPIE